MKLIALLVGLLVERLATQLFHLRQLRWLDRVIALSSEHTAVESFLLLLDQPEDVVALDHVSMLSRGAGANSEGARRSLVWPQSQ